MKSKSLIVWEGNCFMMPVIPLYSHAGTGWRKPIHFCWCWCWCWCNMIFYWLMHLIIQQFLSKEDTSIDASMNCLHMTIIVRWWPFKMLTLVKQLATVLLLWLFQPQKHLGGGLIQTGTEFKRSLTSGNLGTIDDDKEEEEEGDRWSDNRPMDLGKDTS